MIRTGISMLALASFLAAPAVSQTAPATPATSAPTAAEAAGLRRPRPEGS